MILKVVSIEMDLPENGVIRLVFIKGWGAEILATSALHSVYWESLQIFHRSEEAQGTLPIQL